MLQAELDMIIVPAIGNYFDAVRINNTNMALRAQQTVQAALLAVDADEYDNPFDNPDYMEHALERIIELGVTEGFPEVMDGFEDLLSD